MLETAARQVKDRRRRVPSAGGFYLSVNVSTRQLMDASLLETMKAVLSSNELSGAWLNLEVTEGGVIEDFETAALRLNELKQLGVGLHMDDFGTGYSSLSCQHRLPFDIVEIDRPFTASMHDNASFAAVIRAAVTLARSLQPKVTVQGVETAEQLDLVTELGCDFAQGFLLSRPVDADEVVAMPRRGSVLNGACDVRVMIRAGSLSVDHRCSTERLMHPRTSAAGRYAMPAFDPSRRQYACISDPLPEPRSTRCSARPGLVRTALLVALLGASVTSARAQTADDATAVGQAEPPDTPSTQAAPTSHPGGADEEPFGLRTTDRLTGSWGGARPWLEERGFTFEMSTTAYFQQVARGGLNTHNAHNIIGTNDIELSFDFTKMRLIPGGSAYIWATNAWGESPSTRGWVGDLFWVNGGEVGDRPIDVHELWYEQALLDDKLRVRFGKLCLPCSFDYNEFAWDPTTQFINYALNNAPNIPFPALGFGALGVQAIAQPCDWFYLGAGVADADAEFNETGFDTAFHGPDNFFSMYEFGLTPTFETARGKLRGHYRFGLWYDPQPKEEFYNSLDGRRTTAPHKRDDVGLYFNLDQVLLCEKQDDEENTEGLGVFCRYSYAPGDANLVEHFWSLGGQYQGLIPTRDDDVLALGVGQGLLSKDSRLAGFNPRNETVVEAYYSVQLLPWLVLTPDIQWILRPGGEDGRDAWVIGLRLQATF